jgi:hypothetical protein
MGYNTSPLAGEVAPILKLEVNTSPLAGEVAPKARVGTFICPFFSEKV